MRQLVLFVSIVSASSALAGVDPARLAVAGENAPAIRAFSEAAANEFGNPGVKAADFLIAGMPVRDLRSLTKEFLLENLRLAMQTRTEFPWSGKVSDELFLDSVLPYAQLDEPRDPWRAGFHKQCGGIVKDCKTATEAVQALNSVFFEQIKVKYGTKRKRANQSPKESIEQGVASCTGLSIILADACRSVGIPARVAGTAMWTQINGNHTWAEVWDGGWHFTGAAEPSAEGLDHGWFNDNASKAVAEDPVHAIWANTWTPGKDHFPLIWNLTDRSVFAVNVTHRYTSAHQNKAPAADRKTTTKIHLRVLDDSGQRLVARVELLDISKKSPQAVTTKAGTADLNDMPSIEVQPASEFILRVVLNGETRDFPIGGKEAGDTTLDLAWKNGAPVKSSQGK